MLSSVWKPVEHQGSSAPRVIPLRTPAAAVGSGRQGRLLAAIVVAGLGAAVCLANDAYRQSRSPATPAFDSVTGDLGLVAFPFYLLAAGLILSHARVHAVALAFAVLTVLTWYEYRWYHGHESSSTAGLAFVGSIMLGVPIAVGALILDWLTRRLRDDRERSPR